MVGTNTLSLLYIIPQGNWETQNVCVCLSRREMRYCTGASQQPGSVLLGKTQQQLFSAYCVPFFHWWLPTVYALPIISGPSNGQLALFKRDKPPWNIQFVQRQ